MGAEAYISNAHPAYIESLYSDYQNDTESVEMGWRKFFEGFEFAINNNASNGGAAVVSDGSADELRVYNMILAYRWSGHLEADTNPIRKRRDRKANLHLSFFGLNEKQLEEEFTVGSIIGLPKTSLKNIVARLKEIYCGPFAIQYSYCRDPERRKFIEERFEQRKAVDYGFDLDHKKHILSKLNETTLLEQFLGKKYLGEKRFSLEGGENTIPALDAIINQAADLGVQECVIGMAHRGRLNVLANIMQKTYDQLFSEFEGNTPDGQTMGDGDVKYHLGFRSMFKSQSGKEIHLKLTPNPSHLEAVNPVVLGFARAQADAVYESDYDSILPILIHGDAAVAGQGIAYEVIQMSKLKGYYTGGTIHVVINNQIGFTTDFDDARSSDYCTSLAAVVEAPVIHVNGDDAEAVVYAARVAAEYRQEFNSDVFIDILCYRKHGHNEADDPKFTQPQLYALIEKHPDPRKIYVDKLVNRKDITAAEAKKMEADFIADLQDRLDNVRQKPLPYVYQEPELAWKKLRVSTKKDFEKSPDTKISKTKIANIVKGLIKVPEGFTPLRKANKMLEQRRKLMKDEKTVDWAAAELLAYGSILLDGSDIRMSGQDVKRGTFSHRHAILSDHLTGEEYNRLNFLAKKQGQFRIYNSLLSEFGVLGFEYGYSLSSPDHLVIWEAQFGDFANGAQTMIDQFITAGESKWQKQSGIILLLPHGYEGQGPEHSSARLERFLQGCAEDNIAVANITSPANFFHAIRRQLARPFRKPLVIMSPKSLLRHKRCVSSVDELAVGGFQEIIDDNNTVAKAKVQRVLLCTGKLYYDLLAKKEADKRKDVAIVRMEQIYPIARKQLTSILNKYQNAELVWVQEEPSNMGAWSFILRHLREFNLSLMARKESASPATGFKKIHLKEQQALIEQAFEL